jgi:hypothetical protein
MNKNKLFFFQFQINYFLNKNLKRFNQEYGTHNKKHD